MYWLFLVCALVGGTVFILQFVLAVAGSGVDDLDFGDDIPHDIPHDVPHDMPSHGDHGHGSTWMFGVISFRTVVAALTFFGLAGLASLSADISAPLSLVSSCAAGAGAMYGVHDRMNSL